MCLPSREAAVGESSPESRLKSSRSRMSEQRVSHPVSCTLRMLRSKQRWYRVIDVLCIQGFFYEGERYGEESESEV